MSFEDRDVFYVFEIDPSKQKVKIIRIVPEGVGSSYTIVLVHYKIEGPYEGSSSRRGSQL